MYLAVVEARTMVEAAFASHNVDDNLPLNHLIPDSTRYWILFPPNYPEYQARSKSTLSPRRSTNLLPFDPRLSFLNWHRSPSRFNIPRSADRASPQEKKTSSPLLLSPTRTLSTIHNISYKHWNHKFKLVVFSIPIVQPIPPV
jgi:hypothetical protein